MSDIRVAPGTVEVRGSVGILNVGEGDTKISFDPANPQDRIRAARIVADMLRRGYALMVETASGSKTYVRAQAFDETKCEYIIADFDPVAAMEHDQAEERTDEQTATPPGGAGEAPRDDGRKTRGPAKRRLKAESTRAVAVGRTAGG